MTSFLRHFQRTEWALLLSTVVVLLLTAGMDSQHTYFNNPRPSAVDILRQTALLGIFTLGAAIVIIAGGIDLSSGSVIAFSGSMCATLMVLLAPEEMKPLYDQEGHLVPLSLGIIALAILGTILIGFLIGSLHAWLITVVGLPPFIATLATLVGLRSFARAIVESVTAQVNSNKTTQISISDDRFLDWTKSVPLRVAIFAVL